jgi:mono/diheme cytochrome c family protein
MTQRRLIALMALVAAAAIVPAVAEPQEASVQTSESLVGGEAGDSLYRTYCAGCHGNAGKGDGTLAPSLRVRPSDLTRLTKKGEKFDADKVARVIDGRKEVAGHGGSDMPKWGDAFKRSGDGYSEKAVKDRIDAIAGYIETLQAK